MVAFSPDSMPDPCEGDPLAGVNFEKLGAMIRELAEELFQGHAAGLDFGVDLSDPEFNPLPAAQAGRDEGGTRR